MGEVVRPAAWRTPHNVERIERLRQQSAALWYSHPKNPDTNGERVRGKP